MDSQVPWLGTMPARVVAPRLLPTWSYSMWLALTMVLLALWFFAVGVFHVSGNAIHLVAVLAMVSLGLHLKGRRGKVVSQR